MKNKIIFYLSVALFIIVLQLFLVSAFAQVGVAVNSVPVTVSSGVTVKVNGSVSFNGTTSVANSGTIDVNGNWTNNTASGLFSTSGGTVDLTGTAQVIDGTDATLFHNLNINAVSVTLNQDITTGLNNNSPSTGILLMNNGNLDLNSRQLTIANSSSAGISRVSGMIISETDGISGYGRVKWNIGGFANNYAVPFGNAISNSLLPFNFFVTTSGIPSGTGLGSFTVSTYPTVTSGNPNNRPLPTGVIHLNNALNLDNSAQTLDRYWVLDVDGYSANPTANITMTYRDSEHDGSNGSTNTITEALLKAQCWDGIQWTAQTGVMNTAANTVTITGTNIFNGSWALAGSNSPLPIELLTFSASLNSEKKVDLSWATASETDNDYFTMERSQDGINFESIGIVDGAGNSRSTLFYSGTDHAPFNGVSYYRLKQTDFNGQFTYSNIETIRIDGSSQTGHTLSVYPNPATDHAFVQIQGSDLSASCRVEVYNAIGQLVVKNTIGELQTGNAGVYELRTGNFKSGLYIIRIVNGQEEVGSDKLMVR